MPPTCAYGAGRGHSRGLGSLWGPAAVTAQASDPDTMISVPGSMCLQQMSRRLKSYVAWSGKL